LAVFRLSCSEPERRARVPLTPKELRERQLWETRGWKTESRRSGVSRMRVIGGRDRRKDFEDADGASLEERLTHMLVYLLRNSVTVVERERRADAARQAQADAERRRFEEEQRLWELAEQRLKEQQRVETLLMQAARWRQAEDIRAFVAAAGDASDEDWKAWALAIAVATDPLHPVQQD